MEECPICREDKELKTESCGHKFCNECITEWFKKSETCPMCRRVIKMRIKNVESEKHTLLDTLHQNVTRVYDDHVHDRLIATILRDHILIDEIRSEIRELLNIGYSIITIRIILYRITPRMTHDDINRIIDDVFELYRISSEMSNNIYFHERHDNSRHTLLLIKELKKDMRFLLNGFYIYSDGLLDINKRDIYTIFVHYLDNATTGELQQVDNTKRFIVDYLHHDNFVIGSNYSFFRKFMNGILCKN